MIICGVDLEGGGGSPEGADINTETDLITEIGLVLWDTNFGIIRTFSTLVWEQGQPFPSPSIQSLTHISEEMLRKHGRNYSYAMKAFCAFADQADAVMAYNGTEYDIPMLRAEARRQNLLLPDKTVIDPMTDVDWPTRLTTRSQMYLAAEHGILNPFPHRALTDVLTMMQLTAKYDPVQMKTWADSPVIWLFADVPIQQKDKAKDLFYRWNQDQFPKKWTKKIKSINKDKEFDLARKAGFTPILLQSPATPARFLPKPTAPTT